MTEYAADEVTFEFPWGNIAAKWWGSKSIRPIVLVHGWLDNAGSFDTLVPLLPKEFSYLAIDFPGHGASSQIPSGLYYHGDDNIFVLEEIRLQQKWDRLSLVGHSMGSIVSFLYATIFPENVDLVVALDTLKLQVHSPQMTARLIQYRAEKGFLVDQRGRDESSKPPEYTYDELVERVYEGSFRSVDRSKAHHLLVRSTKRSIDDPNKFYFSRDIRVKYLQLMYCEQEVCLEFIRRIKAAYLFIKATDREFTEPRKHLQQAINTFRQCNRNFEMFKVEGTHHVHLNHPELMGAKISSFLRKYYGFKPNLEESTKSKL